MNHMAPNTGQPVETEAEAQVLGAILVNNRTFDHVCDYLKPEYFSDPANGAIYDWTRELIEGGKSVNPVTLRSLAEQHLKDKGGVRYLTDLAAGVVSVMNAPDSARVVMDAYRRRRLIEAGERLVNDAHDAFVDRTPDQIAGSLMLEIDEIVGAGKPKGDLQHVSAGLDIAIERAQAAYRDGPDTSGLSTGISDMDRAMGMLGAGRLYIAGGRPGMGKSAWAVRVARNVAKAGHSVAFFSLEMPADEISSRLLAAETGISQERQELGDIDKAGWDAMVHAKSDIGSWPLHIDDTAASTVHEIKRRAIKLKRRHGLKLVVIDYLQLIGVDRDRSGRNNNRTNDLTEITAALKALAKELSVPVIALSQLSRAVEAREDKRPTLADLRESGSIEQDADVVLFPYRDEYYAEKAVPVQREGETDAKYQERANLWDERMDRARNTMEIIVGKRRGGRAGHAVLYANMETGVITNGAREMN